MAEFVGVDGCRRGWFAAWQSGDAILSCVYESVHDLCADHFDASRILIDIPIGLTTDVPRGLESEVRKHLGPRKSSVFPVPCYDAAYAANYESASALNRRRIGKGLSKQAWFICPRIRDVDQFLAEQIAARTVIGECHPELAFARLSGEPLIDNKKTSAGQQQRLQILNHHLTGVEPFLEEMLATYPRRDLQLDDCLDALALMITAKQAVPLSTPQEMGAGNIPIRMWVPDC